jgi:hypothetical protein
VRTDNAGMLSGLFGTGGLTPGRDGVELVFTYPLATWEWALAAVAACALAWWSYRRLDAPRWTAVLLAGVRALLLLLVLLLLTGPKLIKPIETLERDWVLVLVDRSGSMSITDAPAAAGSDSLRTREEQLRSALQRAAPAFAELARERTLVPLGFESGTFDLPPSEANAGEGRDNTNDGSSGNGSASPATLGPWALSAPEGQRTNIGAALESALQRAAARPLSGIVLISDGRSTDEPGRALVRRLIAERVPVFTLPLGSAAALADLAVVRAAGPGAAFANDLVPIEAVVERRGGGNAASASIVELVDTATGRVVDQRLVQWPALPTDTASEGETSASALRPPQKVTLTTTPSLAGRSSYQVRVRSEGTAAGPDLVPGNDSASVAVTIVDRPMRVLSLDGTPRWEHRFLKNILSRERSMEFASLVLAAGRRFLAEGSINLQSVPVSHSEWDAFDVIMIGDMGPEVMSPEQIEQIRRRVSVGGAGLMWIAGPGDTPQSWRGTPLADLLPVTLDGDSPLRTWDRDVTVAPAPLSRTLGVMRLSDADPASAGVSVSSGDTTTAGAASADAFWPAVISDPATGWSRLRWAQRLEPARLKPGAEALAFGVPVDGVGAPTPLVLTMRFGAGRVVYVATDEVWRWRYGRGEDLPERFYLQLLRLLGRESVERSGRPALLELSPQRAEVGQTVRVSVELVDQSLIDARPASIAVRVEPTDQQGIATDLTLRPAGGGGPGEGSRTFVGAWVPQRAGAYRVNVTDALLSATPMSLDAVVVRPDDELLRPETDHARLAELSRVTGGRVLGEGELSELPRLLPRREVRIEGIADQRTLWDTWPALLAVLVLLSIEWIGRRIARLA